MNRDFDDLVGSEGTPEELDELRRIHELLLASDPPPAFAQPLRAPLRVRRPVRVRAAVALAFAAAFSAVLGVGTALVVGTGGGSGFRAGFVRPMHGVGAAATAHGTIVVGKADGEGNRPIEFTVKSLPALSREGSYELYLTEHGKLAVPCGVFQTGRAGSAHVRMNAPADLEEYDGWVVTASDSPRVLLST